MEDWNAGTLGLWMKSHHSDIPTFQFDYCTIPVFQFSIVPLSIAFVLDQSPIYSHAAFW
jgi:hypothetical protein